MTGLALVLGPVRMPGPDGVPTPVAGALARRLVVSLALAGASGRSAEALADDVWGADAPRNPRAALQMLVSRLRATTADGLLLSTPAGYRLADSDLAIAEAAEEADADRALALWSGEPGDDVEEATLAAELADRAARARSRLLAARASSRLGAGRPEEALADAEALAALRPTDSAPVALAMRALAALGRTADGLAVFAAFRERLADELGADPDPDLIAVNAELLRAGAGGELVGVRTGRDPLLGRDADLAALDVAVGEHRLVTVLGPGGLGKTRIAHELAAAQRHRFGRVVFVELAGGSSADDVALAVGQAVGARGVRAGRRATDLVGPDLAARTVEALAAARTLLVLDNCEHVVDAAAALADELLATVPDLVVLTTSRVPLLVPGEFVHPLPPLPTETDATALFLRRARAARPDVRLEPATVQRVVGHLDGLPLAIELAAARLRSMTLEALEARLGDRFAVLVGGSRTAPERHRTLFAVIDWSWRLLPTEQQRAAALLGVFPDGFTASSATALLGDDAEALLVQLVDQSLLTFAERPRPRYRMLETVREFALAAAERAGEREEAQRRLDAAMIAFERSVAAGLTGGADRASFVAIGDEEETLRSLLRRDATGREHAVVAVFALLAEYWLYRGEFETVVDAVPAVAAAAGRDRATSDPERFERLRALLLLAVFGAIAELPGTLRLLARVRREARRPPAGTPPLWLALADAVQATDLPDAESAALARMTDSSDPALATLGTLLAAQLHENAGRQRQALLWSRRAERLAAAGGFGWFSDMARSSSAQLLSQLGDRAGALALALAVEADGFGRPTDGDRVTGETDQLDWLIAVNQIANGHLDEAEVRLDRLLAPKRRAPRDGDDMRAIALAGRAELAAARGDDRGRAELWAEAVAATRRTSTPWSGLLRGGAAADAARRGDLVTAAALARRLRYLVLALIRLGRRGRLDHPVVASAALGLATVYASTPATAALGVRLGATAVASGARLDLPSLAAAAGSFVDTEAEEGDPIDAIEALLRSPAARGADHAFRM